jgi:hypothetical protein
MVVDNDGLFSAIVYMVYVAVDPNLCIDVDRRFGV